MAELLIKRRVSTNVMGGSQMMGQPQMQGQMSGYGQPMNATMQMGQSYDQSAAQPMVQQQFVQAQMHMPAQQHSVYSGSQPRKFGRLLTINCNFSDSYFLEMGQMEQNFGTYGDDPNMQMANVMRQNPPPTQKYISDSDEDYPDHRSTTILGS